MHLKRHEVFDLKCTDPFLPCMRFRASLIGVVLASACVSAWCEGSEADFDKELPGLQQLAPGAAWQRLINPAEAWFADAQYHYWRGVFAMQAGQWQDARDSFERTLLLDPDHAGAHYDYGLTLCRLEQTESCKTILSHAKRVYGPPPAWVQPEEPPGKVAVEARFGGGYSSNLNRGPTASTIPVQLQGVTLDFILSESMRPRSGSYTEGSVYLSHENSQNGAQLQAGFYQRFQPQDARLNLATLEWRWPLAPHHSAGLQAYNVSEAAVRRITGVGVTSDWRFQGPLKRLILTLENRQLPSAAASYPALRLDAEFRGVYGWSWRLFQDAEAPSPKRAGEGVRQAGAVFARGWDPTWLGAPDMSLRYAYSRDLQPYSPLFGGKVRTLQQAELQLRLTTPLPLGQTSGRWTPQLRSEWRYLGQRSNIPLFNINEWQLQFSLVWLNQY